MPLSEHEQRVLEQIERALYADDPKFAATVRGIDPKARQRRRYIKSGIGLLLGLALLPAGIAIGQPLGTFAGFLLALAAFLYGVATWRRGPERPDTRVAPGSQRRGFRIRGRKGRQAGLAPSPKPGMMQRFEDRWDRRRDAGGFGN